MQTDIENAIHQRRISNSQDGATVETVTDASCGKIAETDTCNVTDTSCAKFSETYIRNERDLSGGVFSQMQETLRQYWESFGGDHERCYRRQCERCGLLFFVQMPSGKWCSYRCRNDSYIERRKERLQAARNKSCEHCGTAFIGSRADATFCSAKCRQAAHRYMRQ